MVDKVKGITTKKKSVKKIVYKLYAPENKYLSKEEYVNKNKKNKERKIKLAAYNKKLIKEEEDAAAKAIEDAAKAKAAAKAKVDAIVKEEANKNK